LDEVMDFRREDGDRLDLTGTGLAWSDLDSNGSGQLDDGDAFVAIEDGGTRIDLGLASGAAAGRHAVTVAGVTGLQEGDLVLG
jgi:hypothetical protein